MADVIDFNGWATHPKGPDLDDIRSRLHANPRQFVQWLYGGRAAFNVRGQARIGDIQGNKGSSLSIALSGPKAGSWYDHNHNDDRGGDLISLYMAKWNYRDKDLPRALKEIAKEYLGDPIEASYPPWDSATARIEAEKKTKGDRPYEEHEQLGAPSAVYKYFDLNGVVLTAVHRFEMDDGRKTFRPFYRSSDGKWTAGCPPIRPLYNLPGIATAQAVVICEGEKAAQALIDIGIVATSAMNGAGAPLDATDWRPLHGKEITIWPDADDAGANYARKLCDHLVRSANSLRVVDTRGQTDGWDAHDCITGGADATPYLVGAVSFRGESAGPSSRIRLLTLEEIEALPPPTWLIDNVITAGGLSVLWGRSGTYKSFVALDMAMVIATEGALWHGQETKHGTVVYIAAEGAHGLARRAVGWRSHRSGDQRPKLRLVAGSLTLTGDDLGELITAVRALGVEIALIVIDTLARTFGVGDENRTVDMNAYVAAADRLREETGAHVMIVHHSGKDDERGERGNLALRGAADTVIKVERSGDTVKLVNTAPQGKQKDSEEFESITLEARKVRFEHNGNEQTTVLLTKCEPLVGEPEGEKKPTKKSKANDAEATIISVLEKFGTLGWMRLEALSGVPKATLSRAMGNLIGANVVAKDSTTKNYTLIV